MVYRYMGGNKESTAIYRREYRKHKLPETSEWSLDMKFVKKYRNDLLLGAGILLIAGVAAIVYTIMVPSKSGNVVVKVDGEVVGVYPLSEDRETVIRTENGTNTLVIKDGTAYLKDADCPDKLCVKQGKISKTGKIIICLPHKLIVEIVAGEESGLDGVV